MLSLDIAGDGEPTYDLNRKTRLILSSPGWLWSVHGSSGGPRVVRAVVT